MVSQLLRSRSTSARRGSDGWAPRAVQASAAAALAKASAAASSRRSPNATARAPLNASRSEEHTSELQSPCNLVCRLLLEKKKVTDDALRVADAYDQTSDITDQHAV